MAESEVVYRPRDGATLEDELSVLVAAYRYVIFDCHVGKKGARPGARDAAKESEDDRARQKYTE
jgi:hypothetical protein